MALAKDPPPPSNSPFVVGDLVSHLIQFLPPRGRGGLACASCLTRRHVPTCVGDARGAEALDLVLDRWGEEIWPTPDCFDDEDYEMASDGWIGHLILHGKRIENEQRIKETLARNVGDFTYHDYAIALRAHHISDIPDSLLVQYGLGREG